MLSGVVLKGIGGFYYVKTSDTIFECRAKGILRKKKISPLPGDNVIISIVDQLKKIGQIEEVLIRKSQLIRPLVANVNQIAIVASLKSPYPDFMLIENILINAERQNLRVLICVNKMDLGNETTEHEKLLNVYKNTGYTVLFLSCKANRGFDVLNEKLKGKITVLAGQSGVGKSSILNRLMNNTVMEIGEISKKIERGKHTTRHTELIELESKGYIIDTPGFSSFKIQDIDCMDLQLYYPEFKEYSTKCKFYPCMHIKEPGCKVKQAVENNEISRERYSGYMKIFEYLKNINSYKRR